MTSQIAKNVWKATLTPSWVLGAIMILSELPKSQKSELVLLIGAGLVTGTAGLWRTLTNGK